MPEYESISTFLLLRANQYIQFPKEQLLPQPGMLFGFDVRDSIKFVVVHRLG
jgi:hypothetical protein